MLTINNALGVLRACQRGIGVALLPDYPVEENGGLVQLFGVSDTIALDAFSSTRKSSNRLLGCRCFAIFWSRRRTLAFLKHKRRHGSENVCRPRMAGMRPFVLCEKIASAYSTLLAAAGCLSSQIAIVEPPAVPL